VNIHFSQSLSEEVFGSVFENLGCCFDEGRIDNMFKVFCESVVVGVI
jgi:hypothetical protein